MSELILTNTQVEHALGKLESAADRAYANSDLTVEQYQPETVTVPSVDFNEFIGNVGRAIQAGVVLSQVDERLRIEADQQAQVGLLPGLRGLATISVGRQIVQGPAIILADRKSAAMLTAERLVTRERTTIAGQAGSARLQAMISPMQHELLDVEYVKAHAQVSARHTEHDAANAGAVGPALVVVSSSGNAHHELHRLAPDSTDRISRTFGTKFSADGRQHFMVGSQKRSVLSAVCQPGTFVFDTAPHDQPEEFIIGGTEINSVQKAVGMTLAATVSREAGHTDRLADNLRNMTGV